MIITKKKKKNRVRLYSLVTRKIRYRSAQIPQTPCIPTRIRLYYSFSKLSIPLLFPCRIPLYYNYCYTRNILNVKEYVNPCAAYAYLQTATTPGYGIHVSPEYGIYRAPSTCDGGGVRALSLRTCRRHER